MPIWAMIGTPHHEAAPQALRPAAFSLLTAGPNIVAFWYDFSNVP